MERRTFLRGAAASGVATTVSAGAAAPAGAAERGPLRVQVVLFDGVEEQDFAGPYEVFSAAGMHAARGTEVSYARVDGPGVVTAAYGTKVQVERGWAPGEADVLVVPGGGYSKKQGPGIWGEIRKGALPSALAEARRDGLIFASLCTGALLLGAAGLVRGRPCTTHHGAKADLAAQGGVVKDARVVDDGSLVTAGGITSGLDLALWLVHRELGADAAVGVETMLEYEARGTVWTH
ncbi:DJ-1/PfpI family protein [Amycolatopsis jiangsuensis]|uniref:Transcriptional regulator GlxA family with amidase domain n=1 Tax=Amycolatopsis jiangsuensis TaxID=1181879 RepID=A0A840IUX7_9PSEU|nr:DJ-1/PfpI family protein [Amycolatopsis jiangsuensis]MBB4684958.1 transcriptional regulator GlxA family with amidase domain [Amycolatopsis jiangsuensis]